MSDMVNHPSHFNTGRIEVIDFIEDNHFNFSLGNVVKYICRAGKKDPEKTIEDLQKAEWYLHREIQRLEAQKQRDAREAELKAEKAKKVADNGITFRDELMTSFIRHPRSWAKAMGREDLIEQLPENNRLSWAEAAEIAAELAAAPRREVRTPEGVQS